MEFIRDVVSRLESSAVTYAITGSIASNYWGVPRLTHDLDVLLALGEGAVEAIVQSFPPPYYVSEPAVRQAAVARGMFNVIHTTSGFKADLWVSPGGAFAQSMLKRRKHIEIMAGLHAWIGSPEDVLLHKLVWHKITPSDRQVADAAGIAKVQAGRLDLDYLKNWAGQQGTTEVLLSVLAGKGLKAT